MSKSLKTTLWVLAGLAVVVVVSVLETMWWEGRSNQLAEFRSAIEANEKIDVRHDFRQYKTLPGVPVGQP